jgi:TRAP-type C4-dicarboxylate transport system permease small subunit
MAAGLITVVPDNCRDNVVGGCKSICDLAQLAQNVLNDAIYIAVFLSAVLFAWAGFKYLTNVANSGEVSRAKEIFVNVAVGLVIILAGWLVVDVLMRTLVGASVLPWNKIC